MVNKCKKGVEFMKISKKIVLSILVILIFFTGSFILYNVQNSKLKCTVDPSKVSSIEIFSGNTGKMYKITEQSNIEHIVRNLNSITFNKGEAYKGNDGFDLITLIKDKDGKTLWNYEFGSSNWIRYGNYYYNDNTSSIDYDYVKKLLTTITPVPNYGFSEFFTKGQ